MPAAHTLDPGLDVDAYLQRIGIAHRRRPDLGWLSELQEQHLLTVPFENLSVRAGEPITLDENHLYAKIVSSRRGGFCYELNSLFGWLLSQLNFVVARVSASVYDAEHRRFGPPFDHMALLVSLDRHFLVDVGFGDSARGPIPLPNGRTTDVSGSYRLATESGQPGIYILEQYHDGAWRPAYRFDSAPRALSEYASMCRYHQSSPASHFTQRTVCTLATPAGRVTLSSDALTVTHATHKTRIPVTTPADRQRLLVQVFGIASGAIPAADW